MTSFKHFFLGTFSIQKIEREIQISKFRSLSVIPRDKESGYRIDFTIQYPHCHVTKEQDVEM